MSTNQIWIGFSTPNRFNVISWAIRKLTKSQASHAWISYYDTDFKMPMVMDAHEFGFRIISLENFQKRNKIIASVLIPADWDFDSGLAYLAKLLGSRYDYVGVLGLVFASIGAVFRKQCRNPFSSPDSVFCSESVVRALQKINRAQPLDPDRSNPKSLMGWFAASDMLKVGVSPSYDDS